MTTLADAVGHDVSRETCEKLDAFLSLLIDGNRTQNLISKASEGEAWDRHILDSAQLLRLVEAGQSWSDIGTGPGLPGLVLAILDRGPKILVEPRRKRVDFLAKAVELLALDNVSIVAGTAEAATTPSNVITARAVASPGGLFAMTSHLRHDRTTYVLPRGRSATSELAELGNTWQGAFRLHQSLTSDDASILVARNVRRRGSR